jgi:homoserine O-acetyltransferase
LIQTAAQTFLLPAPLPLSEGGLMLNAEIAYEAYGAPVTEDVVVVLHDITASHRALADPEPSLYKPSGWALQLIGSGRVIDPSGDYVVSPNLLGSPFGSTSPAKKDPTGSPMGTDFPSASTEDMARAVAGLLRGLGVTRVRMVVGIGLGGMVALHLAAVFPNLAAGVVALGASKALPERLREQLTLARQVLSSDPDFKEGKYYPERGPTRTLKKLRLEMLRLHYTKEALAASHADMAAAERRLESEADAFAQQFDANSYALLCGAYGGCDLSHLLSKISCRVLLVASSSDEIAPPTRVRDTYHALSAAGVQAHYHELQSDRGHSGLLKEATRLRAPIGEFMSGLR